MQALLWVKNELNLVKEHYHKFKRDLYRLRSKLHLINDTEFYIDE